MPQKLASLQSQLSALCWRRWFLRVVYGSLAVAIALGLALAAAFALVPLAIMLLYLFIVRRFGAFDAL